MSWDKNTVNKSCIQKLAKALDIAGSEYKLDLIGSIHGMGINDNTCWCLKECTCGAKEENRGMYLVYRLEMDGTVWLDQMQRTQNCDSDDVFTTVSYAVENEHEYLGQEVYIHDEGICDECYDNLWNKVIEDWRCESYKNGKRFFTRKEFLEIMDNYK